VSKPYKLEDFAIDAVKLLKFAGASPLPATMPEPSLRTEFSPPPASPCHPPVVPDTTCFTAPSPCHTHRPDSASQHSCLPIGTVLPRLLVGSTPPFFCSTNGATASSAPPPAGPSPVPPSSVSRRRLLLHPFELSLIRLIIECSKRLCH
jgi:hypothetical protein